MRTKTTKVTRNGKTFEVRLDSPLLDNQPRPGALAGMILMTLAFLSLAALAFICGSALPHSVRPKAPPPCDAHV